MARVVDELTLIELGFELCGSYRFSNDLISPDSSPNQETNHHVRKNALSSFTSKHKPVTTAKRLLRYAERSLPSSGAKKAKLAAQYVINGSASPMETRVAIMLTLPASKGGYGLPQPAMNWKINIKEGVSKVPYGSYRICDFYWSKQKVALEYDSNTFHTTSEQITEDSMKRSELMYLGIKALSMTTSQFFSFSALESQEKTLRKALKIYRSTTATGAEQRRRALHRRLTET